MRLANSLAQTDFPHPGPTAAQHPIVTTRDTKIVGMDPLKAALAAAATPLASQIPSKNSTKTHPKKLPRHATFVRAAP